MHSKKLYIYMLLLLELVPIGAISAQKRWFSLDQDGADQDAIMRSIKTGDSLQDAFSYEEAGVYYQQAYDLAKNQGNIILRNDVGFKQVVLWIDHLARYDKANDLNKQLYQQNCTEDNTFGVIRTTYYKAKILTANKQYTKAIKTYTEALNFLEDTNHTYYKWASHSNRGTVLFNLDPSNRLEKVKDDFEKSIFYLSAANSMEERVVTYSNYASFLGPIDMNKSVEYFSLANDYCAEIPENKYCYGVYNNLSYIYLMKKQPEKALQVLKERLNFDQIKEETNPKYPAVCFHTLGEVYLALDQDSLAIKNIKIAQGFYKKARLWMFLKQASEQLVEVYEEKGDMVNANSELQNIASFMQSFHEEELDKQIGQIKSVQQLKDTQSIKVDLAKKNEAIITQKNEAKTITNTLAWLLGVFVVFLVSWSFYEKLRFHQLNEKMNHNRLRALQINMNPHFLFNSFSTLQNFVLKKEEKKAVNYMKDLSGLMKSIFSSSDSLYIKCNNELAILKSYVALERGRFGNDFEVLWDIAPDVIMANPIIPSMMIQPHIENAIIHGFSHSKTSKQLEVSFSFQNDTHVFVKIKDNGVGRLEAAKIKEQSGRATKSLSVATKNIQERMEIMKDSKIGAASTTIFDLTDTSKGTHGTEVHLVLPIINQTKS